MCRGGLSGSSLWDGVNKGFILGSGRKGRGVERKGGGGGDVRSSRLHSARLM